MFIDLFNNILSIKSCRFSSCMDPLRILPPSKQVNEAEILWAAKKVTIEELGYLEPDLYKVWILIIIYYLQLIILFYFILFFIKQDDTFLCKALVRWLNTQYEWWYIVCPNCAKQMHKDPTTGQLICQKTSKSGSNSLVNDLYTIL